MSVGYKNSRCERKKVGRRPREKQRRLPENFSQGYGKKVPKDVEDFLSEVIKCSMI